MWACLKSTLLNLICIKPLARYNMNTTLFSFSNKPMSSSCTHTHGMCTDTHTQMHIVKQEQMWNPTFRHVDTHTRCIAAAGQTQLGSDRPSSRLPYCLKPGAGLCVWECVGPRVPRRGLMVILGSSRVIRLRRRGFGMSSLPLYNKHRASTQEVES